MSNYYYYHVVSTIHCFTDYEVNNMMTTFHSLPDPKLKLEARDRTATALASSGIPITIKTITYITTFVAGINSDYYGMKLFSVYTGMLFCYKCGSVSYE